MIDRNEVLKIAKLSRLKLSEKEVVYYQKHLQKVLTYMESLSKANIDKNTSALQDQRPGIQERADEVVSFKQLEKVLEQAPKVAGQAFEVPKIL